MNAELIKTEVRQIPGLFSYFSANRSKITMGHLKPLTDLAANHVPAKSTQQQAFDELKRLLCNADFAKPFSLFVDVSAFATYAHSFYTASTPYLTLPHKGSPDGATTD